MFIQNNNFFVTFFLSSVLSLSIDTLKKIKTTAYIFYNFKWFKLKKKAILMLEYFLFYAENSS